MGQPPTDNNPSGDPRQGSDPRTACWICRRPNATGSTPLGNTGSNTRVRVCADGTGCRDGRIYHGPPHNVEPHWPGEDCEVCTAERKIQANRAPRSARPGAGNRSRRHR